MIDECVCGICSPCRRSLRELEKPRAPARPVKVVEVKPKPEPKPEPTKSEPKKPKPEKPKPEPDKRGPKFGTVAQRRPSSEWKRRSDSYHHLLTEEQLKELHAQHNRTTRQNVLAERYKVDGRWFHPRAPHGEVKGARYYGCNCVPCGKVWYAYRKNRRKGGT